MRPPTEDVVSNESMPSQTEVVVVGGGIIGVSTALFLAMAGVPVVLCEKGEIAGEQSSRNWGWVRRMGRDPRELPLIVEAMNIWENISQTLGEDVGFRRTGILYACENAQDEASREGWLKAAGPYALDSKMIGAQQLAGLMPGASKIWRSGLYTPSDGRAEPQKAAPARISMIMQVRRVALITLSEKVCQVSVPLHQARKSAPVTPHAAHSVAVAKPRISEKKTAAISSSTGISLADSRSFCRKGREGSRGGDLSGFSSDQMMT